MTILAAKYLTAAKQELPPVGLDLMITGSRDYYRPQRSWGKVMFSQVCVILFTGGMSASMCAGIHTPWRQTSPGSRHPLGADTPPRADPPPRADDMCYGVFKLTFHAPLHLLDLEEHNYIYGSKSLRLTRTFSLVG